MLYSYRDCIISYAYDDTGWYALKWAAGFGSFGSDNQDNIYENCEVSYAGIRDDGYKPDPVNKGFGIWIDTNWCAAGHGTTVRYNKTYNNAASGLFCEKSQYAKFYYNISYNNGVYGLRVDADGDGDGGAHPVQYNDFYNNTLYGNTVAGIYSAGGWAQDGIYIQNNVFKNNIAAGNINYQLIAKWGGENNGSSGTGNIYEHNSMGAESPNFVEWGVNVYKSTYAAWEAAYGGTTHSIESDPEFVNTSENDFRLKAGSLAIDAGTNVGLTVDCVGNPVSSIPEIGAYEFVASPLPRPSGFRWSIK